MKVYVLIAIREPVPYEDPGAEELACVHATLKGAEECKQRYDAQLAAEGPARRSYESTQIESRMVEP